MALNIVRKKTFKRLLNERNKEVITFNPECDQSNATLDKKARRSRKALPLPCSFDTITSSF